MEVLAHDRTAEKFDALEVDAGEPTSCCIDEISREHRFEDVFQLRPQTQPGETVSNLGVHDDRTGQPVHIEAPLDDGVRNPDGAESNRRRETDRAAANNDYMHQ